jgi:hypothetical protein
VNSLQSATLGRCLIPMTIGDKLKYVPCCAALLHCRRRVMLRHTLPPSFVVCPNRPHIAFEFNCQLTHGGLPVGTLEGTVRLDWSKDKDK